MPQDALAATVAVQAGAQKAMALDSTGNLSTQAGGANSLLNIGAAVAVKATPGRLRKVVILGVVGTGGALTINDCATTGAATTANQIFTTAGTVAVGTVINLDWPCKVGITISAVPTGGTVRLAASFD